MTSGRRWTRQLGVMKVRLDCVPFVWIVFPLFGLCSPCLNCVLFVLIVFPLFRLCSPCLNCVPLVWIVCSLFWLCSLCSDCVPLVWIVFPLFGLCAPCLDWLTHWFDLLIEWLTYWSTQWLFDSLVDDGQLTDCLSNWLDWLNVTETVTVMPSANAMVILQKEEEKDDIKYNVSDMLECNWVRKMTSSIMWMTCLSAVKWERWHQV